MPYGQNTVYVEYRLHAGEPVTLRLRPFITFRMPDAPLSEARKSPFPMTMVRGRYEMPLCEGVAPLKLCLRPHAGVFVADASIRHGISYRVDRDRGSLHVEDLESPGYFTVQLSQERPVSFVASMEPWENLQYEADVIFAAERERLQKLISHASRAPADRLETLRHWRRISSSCSPEAGGRACHGAGLRR